MRPRHHEHRATGARRSRASASSRASRGQRGKTPRWTRQRSSSQSARPRACASHPARRHGSVLRAHPPHRNVARRSQKPSPTCAWDVTRAHHEQRFSANAGRRTGSGRPPMGASDAYSTSSALEPLEPRSAPRRGAMREWAPESYAEEGAEEDCGSGGEGGGNGRKEGRKGEGGGGRGVGEGEGGVGVEGGVEGGMAEGELASGARSRGTRARDLGRHTRDARRGVRAPRTPTTRRRWRRSWRARARRCRPSSASEGGRRPSRAATEAPAVSTATRERICVKERRGRGRRSLRRSAIDESVRRAAHDDRRGPPFARRHERSGPPRFRAWHSRRASRDAARAFAPRGVASRRGVFGVLARSRAPSTRARALPPSPPRRARRRRVGRARV